MEFSRKVHVTYTVEVQGVLRERELPFVLGVLANLSGAPQPALDSLIDRQFVLIDQANFSDVFAAARPRLAFQVENRIAGTGLLDVELKFERLEDFEPHRVASQLPALQPLLEEREGLSQNQRVAEIDRLLSRQLNAVMHAPEFQSLEATWRGLAYLVSQTHSLEKIKIKVLNITRKELYKSLVIAGEITNSIPYKKIHDQIYLTPNADPFAALLGDYEFGNRANDIEMLELLSQIAAAAHAPFLSAAGPSLFECETFEQVLQLRSLANVFEGRDRWSGASQPVIFAKWRSFRSSATSRYVGLTLPRIRLRTPYGSGGRPANGFQFEEESSGQDRRFQLWGNAAYAFCARLAAAFARDGWCAGIQGAEGGLVEGLSTPEVSISDREKEFSPFGFIPLCQQRTANDPRLVFPSAHSARQPEDAEWDRAAAKLPYTFACARFAQCIKALVRDRAASFSSPEECEKALNEWLRQYDVSNPEPQTRQRPLSGSHISLSNGRARLRWSPALQLPPVAIQLTESILLPQFEKRPDANPKPAAQEGFQSILVSRAAPVRVNEGERYKKGDTIGDRFDVQAVHRGGMGVVYAVYDREWRRNCAVKTLQWRFAANLTMRKLFAEEAALWVRLENHPYIVRALLADHYEGLPFVITDYIRGPKGMGSDLRWWIGNPLLTVEKAIELAMQIAQGMQYANTKIPGLLHRDLKPANVLVNSDGRALVTDFGLARAAEADAGTPAYMAPEQWRGGMLDQRTDIYSYGCILYEMFSGYSMFAARSIEGWKEAHLERLPQPISKYKEIPAGIEELVFRCLAKEPQRRPANWDEVAATCAHWFQSLTGKTAQFDFSSYSLNETDLVGPSHSLGMLKRYSEMLEVCERMLARRPDYREALINKVFALNELGRVEEALATVERVLAINPKDPKAWNSKGVLLGRLGRKEESLEAAVKSVIFDPTECLAWRNKASALHRLGRFEEELEACEQAVLIEPRNAEAWYAKLIAFENLGRWEKALEAADQALEIHPHYVQARVERAVALEQIGRREEALKEYDRALALDAEGDRERLKQHAFRAYLKRGNELLDAKSTQEALGAYLRAVAIDSGSALAHLKKGVALRRLGRTEEALAAYNRSLQLDPKSEDALMNKAAALELLGRWEEALVVADRLLALDPKEIRGWEHRAVALGGLNRWEEKLAAAERMLAMDPKSVAANLHCGIALQRLKQLKEALPAYDRVLEAQPSNAKTWRYKGEVLDALGRPMEAVGAYNEALAITPTDCETLTRKAAALQKLERWDEVLADLNRILELDPANQNARQQRDAIARRNGARAAESKGRSLLEEIAGPAPQPTIAQLRQNLRMKFLYDEARIDRAIALERERHPGATLETLMQAAIARWERDGR